MRRGRNSEAAQRFQERRERERTAQRLTARVPKLETLRLDIEDHHGVIAVGPKYARIISVATSPAVFVLACADPSCRDGGHDVTHAVLRSLLEGKTHFVIDEQCQGNTGSANCERTMHVDVTATYRDAS